MEFFHHTLDNGLEIVAECNGEVHSAALGFFVQTGSRDESDELAGVSHFLEHMAFKGTPTRSADDVNREFDEMGAHYNAFTTEESTVYYASVLPECQPRCVALLADILRPVLRLEDFETEKKVIIEEIHMYHDQPPFGADDECKATHFGSHPLSRSVLGTVSSIQRLAAEQMRDYWQRRYSPANIVLAAAGRIDFEALIAQACELCGDWPALAATRDRPPAAPHSGFRCIRREKATQVYVMQLIGAPAAEDADRFPAKLLAIVVGDESGSRFYWELVDTGQAEHASLGHYEYQGAGVYLSYMSCDPERAVSNVTRLRDIYRLVEQDGILAEELAQAQTKVKSRIVLGSERPRNRLFSVGGNWACRHEYRSVKDDLNAIDAVTLDDVIQVLKKYPLSVNTTVAIGPLDEQELRVES